MSIASGFTKMKNYILTSSGYKLLSRWTSSQTVHMGDGTDDTDTVEYRFGAMKGVTSSLATDNDEFALSASAGKNLQDQCTQLNQSLTNIPIFRCGRIRVSYESPQYLKANVVFDKEMPSYDYSVAIGIDSNVLDCTAIYYENRSVHGFGISIYKADAKFTSVDGVNLSWIAAM
jgi:hypothetical protein